MGSFFWFDVDMLTSNIPSGFTQITKAPCCLLCCSGFIQHIHISTTDTKHWKMPGAFFTIASLHSFIDLQMHLHHRLTDSSLSSNYYSDHDPGTFTNQLLTAQSLPVCKNKAAWPFLFPPIAFWASISSNICLRGVIFNYHDRGHAFPVPDAKKK